MKGIPFVGSTTTTFPNPFLWRFSFWGWACSESGNNSKNNVKNIYDNKKNGYNDHDDLKLRARVRIRTARRLRKVPRTRIRITIKNQNILKFQNNGITAIILINTKTTITTIMTTNTIVVIVGKNKNNNDVNIIMTTV